MTLENIINLGWSVFFNRETKRMDTENGRDWVPRYVWRLKRQTETGTERESCEWEGFETFDDCLHDLINKLSTPVPRGGRS